MDKVKLLVVTNSLAQGGNERWVYEICKAINKEMFEIAVLCGEQYLITEPEQNFKNYYYHELKNIGVKLYKYLPTAVERNFLRFNFYRFKRLVRSLVGLSKDKISSKIKEVIKSYDVICVIDFYNYYDLKNELHKRKEGKFFIVLHSHKIQFDFDPYIKTFDKDKTYNFTYFCPNQIAEIGTNGLSIDNNDFFFNPLVLDLFNCDYLFNSADKKEFVIAVFTRITKTKPIDSFIEAFSKIRRQTQNKCFLNLYGEIVDEEYKQHLQKLMKDLEIEPESVRFMGHTKNIADTIKKDKINLYWGVAINTSVGYSSIEVGAMGIPSIFWNWDNSTDSSSIIQQTDGLMMVYNQLEEFVENNLKYIADKDLLAELSTKQRDYIFDKHHIENRINNFEEYVISIKDSANHSK